MNRKTKILIASYSAAFVLAAGGLIYSGWRDNQILRRELEASYLRSIQELSSSVSTISADLNKGVYAGTPTQLNTISSKLWRQAGTAKAALTSLPLDQTGLTGTYRYLSQVGDYAMALSRKALAGEQISEEEHKSLRSLLDYSSKIQEHLNNLESQFSDGSIPVGTLLRQYTNQHKKDEDQAGGNENAPTGQVNEGIKEMESDLTGMPKLIYDGPFSDHMLERAPLLTKGAKEVPQADALKKAAVIAGVKPADLKYTQTEQSIMPSYCFEGNNIDVTVTVNGGLASYLVNGRNVENASISAEQAIKKAQIYLSDLGISNMEPTYYEINNNVLVINFASMQGNVICYTDLIKVGVALDNGEIVHFDSRGYIVNHTERNLPTPKLTAAGGQQSLSRFLTPKSNRLALIPSPGGKEVLCYEYKCVAQDGQNVLVYVNAATGAEEQILLLIINENGQLTV